MINSSINGHRIYAAIVSYNPEADLLGNVMALRDQVAHVLVVDNCSQISGIDVLASLEQMSGVTVLRRSENGGIAIALNEAVRHAQEFGADWLATFDQDSRVEPGMIQAMLQVYDSYPEKEKVAILAPQYQDRSGTLLRNFAVLPDQQSTEYTKVLTVITSGNLVKVSQFNTVGLFREDFFIDYVDHEFCLRCNKMDRIVLQVRAAVLTHNLGNRGEHVFCGREVGVTNHSALRRYYITRNRLYTYRQYITVFPGWVVQDGYAFIKEMVRLFIYEADRTSKLTAMLRGIVHGTLGRLGKS